MKKETTISSGLRLGSFSISRGGFSLIELMIVISIMAVLTGIAAPRYFNAIARYRVEMAARRVAADFSLASFTARQTSKPVVVTFNQAGSAYTMAGVSDLRQRTSSNYFVDLGAEPYRSSFSLVQPASGSQITFDIYGMPSCAGQILLQSGSYTKTALLDQNSGRVTIQ